MNCTHCGQPRANHIHGLQNEWCKTSPGTTYQEPVVRIIGQPDPTAIQKLLAKRHALVGEHISTACNGGEHDGCRGRCKRCNEPCGCYCHAREKAA